MTFEPGAISSNGASRAFPDHVRIAIVGAGFSGIGMSVRLKQRGVEDFVVIERDADVGGTWWANTYPGCACDVPSHLYSFSFAPNPNWSRTFSPQAEILEYIKDCADRYGVRPHVRFNCALERATWDDAARVWRIDTSSGSFSADVLISGAGGLVEPRPPDISGLDKFTGRMFHTARWDHSFDPRDKRVGVIGTGASTIQVVPELQPQVAQLQVFQRTPPWIMPHPDRPIRESERRIYRAFPPAQLAMRAGIYWARETFVIPFMHPRVGKLAERRALTHLHAQVADPVLRDKLTPRYRIGCKRILQSDNYYPALQAPNTELVTDSITELRPEGIVTADGRLHELDAVVLGTGFHVTDFPFGELLVGRGGRPLSDVWRESAQAYCGTTVAGFPNLFAVIGPNTGLGHTSLLVMIEAQIRYVIDALDKMERYGVATVEVREAAQRHYNDDIQRQLQHTVWNTGGCRSWYLDAHGRNTVIWPGATWKFRNRLRHFDLAAYDVQMRSRERTPVVA